MPDAILIKLILIIAGLILTGALITVIGAFAGGWLVFRGQAQKGDKFLSTQSPKGEVFTIPESSGAPNFPGEEEPSPEEKKILSRTIDFLDRFNDKESA